MAEMKMMVIFHLFQKEVVFHFVKFIKKKEKKETLWRVVARGDGLFFARMHLFTDETFSKAWMYPPSLRSNDTIYAGVVLANGPEEATVSLTSCWASNTRHEIVNMKQPELQPNEITLPLIQDGCAVKSPPNLVNGGERR